MAVYQSTFLFRSCEIIWCLSWPRTVQTQLTNNAKKCTEVFLICSFIEDAWGWCQQECIWFPRSLCIAFSILAILLDPSHQERSPQEHKDVLGVVRIDKRPVSDDQLRFELPVCVGLGLERPLLAMSHSVPEAKCLSLITVKGIVYSKLIIFHPPRPWTQCTWC